jgi:hypothetical protein
LYGIDYFQTVRFYPFASIDRHLSDSISYR